jgi:uncharacterized protein
VPVLEPVGPDRVEELRTFLARDPVQNLYPLGILEEHGISGRQGATPMRFVMLRDDGAIAAAAFLGGALVIPSVYEPPAATALGRALQGSVQLKGSIGERYAVDALFWSLSAGAAVRVSRPQRLYMATADALGPFVEPQLKPATLAEVDEVVPLAAGWVRENMGRDPLGAGAPLFRARVERRISAGRTYVYRQGGPIVFKAEVGLRSQYGAEIEGIYTVPAYRKKGIATRALGQLSRTLLSSLPRMTIRIDERDVALTSACRKVGLVPARPQRLLLLD